MAFLHILLHKTERYFTYATAVKKLPRKGGASLLLSFVVVYYLARLGSIAAAVVEQLSYRKSAAREEVMLVLNKGETYRLCNSLAAYAQDSLFQLFKAEVAMEGWWRNTDCLSAPREE